MKKQVFKADFIYGTDKLEAFPKHNYPEIAFSGRSNVGKSSLINSIVLRKNLAHISSAPGKTQEINFFLIDSKWCLVDMPGFGYAFRGKAFQEKWYKLNYDYLEKRENLKFVCVLIDSRHDPQAKDLELIEWLENREKKYLILLTKCDKSKSKEVQDRKIQIDTLVSACKHCLEVLPYSSVTELGRNELIGIIKRELSN